MKKENQNSIYDFSLDATQKIIFFAMIFICISLIKVPGIATVAILGITIFGRLLLFTPIQILINTIFGNKERKHPFMHISHSLWVKIVLVSLLGITVIDTIRQGDLFAIPVVLVIDVVAFMLFTKDAGVTFEPEKTDPNKKGTYMWKKVNGVEFVMNNEAGQRIYRDKNGNYYQGSSYVPIPAPVTIENKK